MVLGRSQGSKAKAAKAGADDEAVALFGTPLSRLGESRAVGFVRSCGHALRAAPVSAFRQSAPQGEVDAAQLRLEVTDKLDPKLSVTVSARARTSRPRSRRLPPPPTSARRARPAASHAD